MTALQQRLLEVFDTEYRDHLEAIRRILGKSRGPQGELALSDLVETTRRAHSLKGAARAVGLTHVETLAHSLEALFRSVQEGETAYNIYMNQQILDALDEIEDHVVSSQSANSRSSEAPQIASATAALQDGSASPLADETSAGMAATPAEPGRSSMVRLDADNLDSLIKSAGELYDDMLLQSANMRDMWAITQEMIAIEREWSLLWKRVQPAMQEDGATKAFRRSINAGAAFAQKLKALVNHVNTAAQSQDRCARSFRNHVAELETRVKAARMVGAESVFGGFRKMVRDIAASEGKDVEIVVEGLDCEADRIILQQIRDPVMHVLRNSVSHGIELPADRQAAGKTPKGRIGLRITVKSDRLLIGIEDDGRGIDFRRVAEKAVSGGFLAKDQEGGATAETLRHVLFEPGFSTAREVTTISGRGVGLSIVREAVSRLQGTVSIETDAGKGTSMSLSLPLSVLSRRLLLISHQNQTYALPCDAVAKCLRVAVQDVRQIDGKPALSFRGEMIPLRSIDDFISHGGMTVAADKAFTNVVVLNRGNRFIALAVEAFAGIDDFVVRILDGVDAQNRLGAGVISTDDGQPCLVLDSETFLAPDDALRSHGLTFEKKQTEPKRTPVILVVDDSITTRTLEKSILEAHGYEVRLSVDGRDAMTQLRSGPVDIVVSDVEMPHLDGFELVRSMKQDAQLARIPVILVTSRDDPADRMRGLELGAEAYVIKQKFDQGDLLATIGQMV